jgi:signal transduction histidine kinase
MDSAPRDLRAGDEVTTRQALVDGAIGAAYAAFFLGYSLVLLGPKALFLPRIGQPSVSLGGLAVDFRIDLVSQASVVFVIACAIGLALRRVEPRASFILVGSVAVLQVAIGEPISFWNVAMLASIFSVAAYSSRTFSRVALLLTGGGYLAVLVLGSNLLERLPYLPNPVDVIASPRGATFVAIFGLLVMIWALGDQVRAGRERLELERQRAVQADREREARAQLGALAERHQIARELHAVVAHGLAVVVVQADGALYASAEHPEAPQRALAAIAATGREALGEMRRLLNVLRDSADPSQLAPQPGIGAVDDLVAGFRGVGLSVDVVVEGQAGTLDAASGLTAYRVIQESLTNVLRHAGPVATVVRLAHTPAGLEIEVENGPSQSPAPAGTTDGLGLTGMRERVALLGGSMTAGPTADGGFAVRVRIPRAADATSTANNVSSATSRTA